MNIRDNMRDYVKRAEEFNYEVSVEYYNAGAGLSDEFHIKDIFEKYADLSDRAAYDGIFSEKPNGTPERELNYLRAYVTMLFSENEMKELSEEIENEELGAQVDFGGEKIAFRTLPVKIANAEDRKGRLGLGNAYAKELDRVNGKRRELVEKRISLAQSLGYRNYTDMIVKLNSFKIAEMKPQLVKLQEDSEEPYRRSLEKWADKAIGVPFGELDRTDGSYLFRGKEFDHLFPKERLVDALKRTLLGMGLNLDEQKNVMLDIEEREKKSPRAFCVSPRIPQDVRLVLRPMGGHQDFSTLFHEAGHMEFNAFMDEGMTYTYRDLGDISLHENFAFLLQYLTASPVWLNTILGKNDYQEFLDFHRLVKLYFIRRYIAKLLYELELYEDNSLNGKENIYQDYLSSATMMKYPKEMYLFDVDPGYYVFKYLQAWIGECQFRDYLINRFDLNWFEKPAAGEFLTGVWKEGLTYDIWERVKMLGYPALDLRYITKELIG